MGSLGIAIDGGRYVRMDGKIAVVGTNIRLQTLKAGQDSARLKFASFHHRGRAVSRRTCVVSGLRGSGREPSEIRLRVERRSRVRWIVTIRLPDGARREVSIRTGAVLWPLLIPVGLALAFGILFILPGLSIPGSTDEAVSPPDARPGIGGSPSLQTPLKASDLPEFEEFTVTVFFDAESAVLDAVARSRLQEMLDSVPEFAHLIVEGHCAAFGTEQGRLRLSKQRARVVADYLISRLPGGVSVEAEGFGVSRPLTDDPRRQELNRRVEIAVTETTP